MHLARRERPWPEVSTAQLRRLLAAGSTLVLDARSPLEWAISHLPGARNVGPKPGVPMGEYVGDVREIARLTQGNPSVPLLIYCNGPHCRKTYRLAAELRDAGFTDVRCYHLGAPVWRALGGLMVVEKEGAAYILRNDRTACWVDASRAGCAFPFPNLPGVVRLPQGSVSDAKNDGRLPMEDHNTRVVVFGSTVSEARTVAQELGSHAFHNVTYFNGTARLLAQTLQAADPGTGFTACKAAVVIQPGIRPHSG
ncbi:rhodanese-like domain-containing protein [Deinococcus malanensis]|uniref:rhodanese-like domain-containing protein n=1 Tax=Deinococcus malanensis TaxID=1706855 RepID=UPI0036430DCA